MGRRPRTYPKEPVQRSGQHAPSGANCTRQSVGTGPAEAWSMKLGTPPPSPSRSEGSGATHAPLPGGTKLKSRQSPSSAKASNPNPISPEARAVLSEATDRTQLDLGALMDRISRSTASSRGEGALKELGAPDPGHPMMEHTETVRRRLAAAGLPTRAEGVEIHVLGENPAGSHGPSVVRSIAGPAGLGQGAAVHLHDPVRAPTSAQVFGGVQKLRAGTLGLEDTLKLGVDRLVLPVEGAALELAQLRTRVPKDGKTRLATMSWGESIERVSRELALDGGRGGPGSALLREVNRDLTAEGRKSIEASDPRLLPKLQAVLADRLQRETESPSSRARLEGARERLSQEVALSREAGILPMASAGNEGNPELVAQVPAAHRPRVEARFRSTLAGVPGLLIVGASELGRPGDLSDDRVWRNSNHGADLIAPGRRMPVGRPAADDPAASRPRDIDGTSFSLPYTAGVAGLMLAANPELGVSQLESILRDDWVLHDVPRDERDGGGVLDEERAVLRARAARR